MSKSVLKEALELCDDEKYFQNNEKIKKLKKKSKKLSSSLKKQQLQKKDDSKVDLTLKLQYLQQLSKPIVKYEQIKNMQLESKGKSRSVEAKEKEEKTAFTDDDFKNFAKSYFAQ